MSKTGTHGGQRINAGRPNLTGQQNHMKRPRIRAGDTLHISLPLKDGLPDLRREKYLKLFYRSLIRSFRFQWSVVSYGFSKGKIDLLVKSKSNQKLSRAMQSFSIGLAKGLNTKLSRSGSVFNGRYRLVMLTSNQSIRRLKNQLKALFSEKKFKQVFQKLIETVKKENENLAIKIKALNAI